MNYSKDIELALDDLQTFIQCYAEMIDYHKSNKTQPTISEIMEIQDKINQPMLLILELLLAPSGCYNTRKI